MIEPCTVPAQILVAFARFESYIIDYTSVSILGFSPNRIPDVLKRVTIIKARQSHCALSSLVM